MVKKYFEGAEKDNNTRINQARDTGLAIVLIVLLFIYFTHNLRLLPVAAALLFICMVWPKIFKPMAKVWFGVSHIMGMVMSKIILTIIFFSFVTTVGKIRKLMGADPMQIKKWKHDDNSVFRLRNDTIKATDMEQPY